VATFLLKRFFKREPAPSTSPEPEPEPKPTWSVTAGNEKTLRGIPAIGRGVQGHIEGTRPDQASTIQRQKS
jgi:hypothetical protein